MKRTSKNPNPHDGSNFDDFLKEQGIYEEVVARAEKEILAWKIEEAMKEKRMTVTALAKAMGTSRAAVDRIINPSNPSITLLTLQKAAAALGKRWKLDLVEA
jgi:antitoxin HicB